MKDSELQTEFQMKEYKNTSRAGRKVSDVEGTDQAIRHLMLNNGTAKTTDRAGFWEGLEDALPTKAECDEIAKKFDAWCERRGIRTFGWDKNPLEYRNHDETAHSINDIADVDFTDDSLAA